MVLQRDIKAGEELVTGRQAARRLHYGETALDVWRRGGGGFPEPVGTLGPSLVWLWSDVMEWARRTGRVQ